MNTDKEQGRRRGCLLIMVTCTLCMILACTGTHLYVTCNNNTDFFESLYLARITENDKYVIVAEPRGNGLIDVQYDDEFQWIVRLFDGSEEVFADSGEISLVRDSRCAVAQDTADTFLVTWEE